VRRLALLLALFAVLSACGSSGRAMRPPGPDQTLSIVTTTTIGEQIDPEPTDVIDTLPTTTEAPLQAMELVLPFTSGNPIPDQYTCRGDNISPSIAWANVPDGAVELAVTMVDLDSDPPNFVHWVVTGIDPAVGNMAPGGLAVGAVEHQNDAGGRGWGGPCPESGLHTYVFTLIALDEPTDLAELTPADEAIAAVEERRLASVALTGTFGGPDTTTTVDSNDTTGADEGSGTPAGADDATGVTTTAP
jgi:Raf kinase inhibitor-like YbhB/YbcL family protein